MGRDMHEQTKQERRQLGLAAAIAVVTGEAMIEPVGKLSRTN